MSSDSPNEIAIQVRNVAKLYDLRAHQTGLRDALANEFKRKLRGASPDQDRHLWALKDVSFEIPQGQAFGIMGPNGAGKSTMLKILARVTKPTSGSVHAKGRLAALIELGAGFHPDLTGRENIYLNGTIMGLKRPEIRRNFDAIVQFSGLERFLDTPVKRYSSGMYVRLGFAVAAYVNPDVLIVDEVLAVGDSEFRQRCAQRIDELQAQGTTIVLVSHNLYLVRSVCQAAILLEHGQVKAQGDVVRVINAYESSLRQAQIANARANGHHKAAPALSTRIQIKEVQVRNLRNPDAKLLSSRDAAELLVHYDAFEPLPKPNLVIRITRTDGTTACMIRTADYGFAVDTLHGQGLISLVIDPLQLTGGAYNVQAQLNGAMDGLTIAEAHSPWFEIAGPTVAWEKGGVFIPHVASVQVRGNPKPEQHSR